MLRLLLLIGLIGSMRAELPLAPSRRSPFDLAVISGGTTRYAAWSDLRKLPTTHLHLPGEFVAGDQTVTAVFLSDLWANLPHEPAADTILAVCDDGYASVYRDSFIQEYRPFLVLEINGQGPDHWPPPGLQFNPGPYVISVSAAVAPRVAQLLDPGHKRPWGVTSIELASYAVRYADSYSGKWARLSARAQAGREIWVNSCASCHAGPGKTFGGTKSGQPFAVLEALAASNPGFLARYVRAPLSLNPQAKMEAHAHYTDLQLAAIIAFIGAERP